MSGFAWVTLATNDSYSLGALVLAHSLRQVGTAHQLAVLVTPGVTDVMRKNLADVFNVVEEVNIFDSKDEANLRLLKRPELGVTFTKLHCWRLTKFEKCVFLDADVLVLVNSDELFEREEFSAAPDVGWPDCFNSGVFVYRPSLETYNKLVDFALQKGSFDGGDQGLLNAFFSDWAHKDISKHLPFIYNMCSTACYSYLPAFKYYGADVKIVHFIGSAKPWLQYFDTESRQVHPTPDLQHLKQVLQRWWDVFCSVIHPKLTPDMSGLAGAFAQFTLGVKRSATQDALENHLRRQAWETGNIDYLGRDSFDNIWNKICQTLSNTELEAAPVKDGAFSSDTQQSPVTQEAQQPQVEQVQEPPKAPEQIQPPESTAPEKVEEGQSAEVPKTEEEKPVEIPEKIEIPPSEKPAEVPLPSAEVTPQPEAPVESEKPAEVSSDAIAQQPAEIPPEADKSAEVLPQLEKPVEIPLDVAPQLEKAAEISPELQQPVEIAPQLEKPAEITPQLQPVEVAPQLEKPTEIAPESEKPVEISPQPEKPVEILSESEKPVEVSPQPEKPVEILPESEKPAETASQPEKLVEVLPEPVVQQSVETPLEEKPAQVAPQAEKPAEVVPQVVESASEVKSEIAPPETPKTEETIVFPKEVVSEEISKAKEEPKSEVETVLPVQEELVKVETKTETVEPVQEVQKEEAKVPSSESVAKIPVDTDKKVPPPQPSEPVVQKEEKPEKKKEEVTSVPLIPPESPKVEQLAAEKTKEVETKKESKESTKTETKSEAAKVEEAEVAAEASVPKSDPAPKETPKKKVKKVKKVVKTPGESSDGSAKK